MTSFRNDPLVDRINLAIFVSESTWICPMFAQWRQPGKNPFN